MTSGKPCLLNRITDSILNTLKLIRGPFDQSRGPTQSTHGEAQCVNKKSQTRLHQPVEQANTIMDDNSVEMDKQGEGVPDVFAPDSSKGRDPGKMPMEVSHTSA